MTAPHIVDPAGLLGEALAEASPDLMRSLLQTVINALLSVDADAVVGAEWGQAKQGWGVERNGDRHRGLDTRGGNVTGRLLEDAVQGGLAAPPGGGTTSITDTMTNPATALHHYAGLNYEATASTA